jgi:peptidoglycan-associated lipoprotein
MWIAGSAKPAALFACMLLAAACAENKSEPPVAALQPAPSVPLGSTQDFFLNVGDRIFFAENSAELTPTSLATLDKQAEWLVRYPNYRITVEGHSDEKGAKEKNMKLSKQRADAVRNYFVAKAIEPARIRTVFFGRERRIATCNDMSCWSQNRRVVTVLDIGPMEPVVARARPGMMPPPGPAALPTYAPPPPRG